MTVNGGSGFGDFERGVQPSGFLATTTYQPPQAIYQEGTDVIARGARRRSPNSRRTKACSATSASTTTTSWRRCCPGNRRARVEYQPRYGGQRRRPAHISSTTACASPATGRCTFYYGPKEFDVLQAVDPELVRAIHFGVVRVPRHAAPQVAQVGERLRRQLRLVDHPADDHHQPADVPAAAQERGVHAEDAGRSSRRSKPSRIATPS